MKNSNISRFEPLLSGEFMCPGAFVVQSNAPLTDNRSSGGLFSAHYDIGMDARICLHEKPSHHICSLGTNPKGIALKIMSFSAAPYLNKRLKMTGHVKSKAVKAWLGLFLRVDGPENRMLSLNGKCFGPPAGTRDWERCQIRIDVPRVGERIYYGILLSGSGRIWANGFTFNAF
jgi:hypothetical protein